MGPADFGSRRELLLPALMISASNSALDLVLKRIIHRRILRRQAPAEVVRLIAGNGRQPCSKAAGFPQCGPPPELPRFLSGRVAPRVRLWPTL